MPIYTYRFDDNTEREESFPSGKAPDTLEIDGRQARKVPSPVAIHFSGPVYRALAVKGQRVLERGEERDAKNIRAHRQQQIDALRRKVIAETVQEFPL